MGDCPASVVFNVLDDYYDTEFRCELPAGHEGDHAARFPAYEGRGRDGQRAELRGEDVTLRWADVAEGARDGA